MRLLYLIGPILIVVYHFIFIISNNLFDVFISLNWEWITYSLLVPLVISVLLIALVWLLFYYFFKSTQKTSFATSIVTFIIFSYGRLIDMLNLFFTSTGYSGLQLDVPSTNTAITYNVFPHSSIMAILLILVLYLIYKIFKSNKSFFMVNKYIFIIVGALIMFNFLNVGRYFYTYAYNNENKTSKTYNALSPKKTMHNSPNIYFFILDGYAREDILVKIYSYDNYKFLNRLEENDFFIANMSDSNYAQTLLSIGSLFNMGYFNKKSKKEQFSMVRIDNANIVTDILKKHGYKIIFLSSGYGTTNHVKWADIRCSYGNATDFQAIIIRSSILRSLENFTNFWDADMYTRFKDNLGQITRSYRYFPDSPKFVFCHFLQPHPPYLFDKEGNKLSYKTRGWEVGQKNSDWVMRQKYVDQLIYLNNELLCTINKVIKNDKTNPIIILQADHGTAYSSAINGDFSEKNKDLMKERFAILNAYRLPRECRSKLYPAISPVNTFRIIFNCVFGYNFKLLPDNKYFSSYYGGHKNRFKFIKIK